MVAFYYLVRAKLIRHIKENGEIDFLQFEEKFENQNPIIARNSAFNMYQNFVDVLLEGKNKKYHSHDQAREGLTPFIDPGTKTKIQSGENEIQFSHSFGKGIGVFLVVNKPIPAHIYNDEKGKEIFIHGIGNINQLNDPDSLITELEREYEYYKFNKYETQNKVIEIIFCNSQEWQEGYLGNGQWSDSYGEPNSYTILQTPFDWNGYDKAYWWDEPYKEKNEEIPKTSQTIKEIILDGESNQVEFKPSLLYNFKTGKAGIGIKSIIAKAICAFLNSNGGILFIGLADSGEPKGLSYDFSLSGNKDEKDFFLLEYDQMLKHFLSFSVKSNVTGQFYQLDDKNIFVVMVEPSRRGPIFLNALNGKEFYVRGEASTRQLSDIEEIVNYCIEKWSY